MKTIIYSAVFCLVVALSSGCYYDNEEYLYPTAGLCDTANTTFSTVNTILQNNCVGCHSTGNAGGGYDLSNYTGVKVSADDGSLYATITWASGHSPMPKNGSKLDACSINKVKAWIDRGALNN
jgi:hypothetical protein